MRQFADRFSTTVAEFPCRLLFATLCILGSAGCPAYNSSNIDSVVTEYIALKQIHNNMVITKSDGSAKINDFLKFANKYTDTDIEHIVLNEASHLDHAEFKLISVMNKLNIVSILINSSDFVYLQSEPSTGDYLDAIVLKRIIDFYYENVDNYLRNHIKFGKIVESIGGIKDLANGSGNFCIVILCSRNYLCNNEYITHRIYQYSISHNAQCKIVLANKYLINDVDDFAAVYNFMGRVEWGDPQVHLFNDIFLKGLLLDEYIVIIRRINKECELILVNGCEIEYALYDI